MHRDCILAAVTVTAWLRLVLVLFRRRTVGRGASNVTAPAALAVTKPPMTRTVRVSGPGPRPHFKSGAAVIERVISS